MQHSDTDQFDVLVIGGGVNGCGIARDASGRGYSVCLAEANDLASGTSSASTKLIHGGLRYLETYEFQLVRKALTERETLWAAAPHIIWPMRFVLPHVPGMRPAWMLRAGLLLYDNLGKRNALPPTRTLDLRRDQVGQALKEGMRTAFEYSDCWVDDARLVVLNAADAAKHGAVVHTRTKITDAVDEGGFWTATAVGPGGTEKLRAKMIVNAGGASASHIASNILGFKQTKPLRLVQGSHIIVAKKFNHTSAYIFQAPDRRIIFAIPYQNDFTLIGTTDVDFNGDPAHAKITQAEIDYLCKTASIYLREPVKPEDIISSYAGLRPLYDDGSKSAQQATRDYVLDIASGPNGTVVLNVIGGKITTYRTLAEQAVSYIAAKLGVRGKSWTARAPLPGGDFATTEFESKCEQMQSDFPFLEPAHARRLVRLYGTNAAVAIDNAKSATDLGVCFGADLYESEVHYLMQNEWASQAEDVLWRRTKCGLRVSQDQIASLEQFMAKAA